MSYCDRYFGCLNGDVDWKTVLKVLAIKDASDNEFINICFTDRSSCTGYESAFSCLQDATLRDVLELIVGEDACGRPAINVLGNICETCTDWEADQAAGQKT